MSKLLFLEDAYQKEAVGVVIGHTPEGGILLGAHLF